MIKVSSVSELNSVLKAHVVFALLVEGIVYELEILLELRKIFAACPKVRRVFYGKISDTELAFQLSKLGCDEYKSYDQLDELVEVLQELKVGSKFEINLSKFGIEMERCSYWTQKYLRFLLKNDNLLRDRVSEIANQINISIKSLERSVRQDCGLSPKHILLGLNFIM